MTALHIASKNADTKIIGMLLRGGADANITSRFGDTPLLLACGACGDSDETSMRAKGATVQLVEAGAKPPTAAILSFCSIFMNSPP